MGEDEAFLKYIYQEDLYMIDEPGPLVESEDEVTEVISDQKVKEVIVESTNFVEESKPVSFLGNNEKGILILVDDPSDDLLNQGDLDLLMRIVESGLKYSKNDFALVNTAKFPVDQILNEISYSYLISFGVDLSNVFSDTNLYTIHQVENSNVLLSEKLSSMHNDNQRKRKLWLALQSMFKISK